MKKATRDRLVLPLLIPLGALVVIAIPVIGFSRILLSLSAHAATVTAFVVVVAIMLLAIRFASLPRIRAATLVGMLGGVAGVAMVAGGIALASIGSGEEAPSGPAPPPATVIAVAAPVGAASKGYVDTKLTAPAGPAEIKFDNQDTSPSTDHNVDVYTDKDYTSSIGSVTPFQGPAVKTFRLSTPLKDGTTYYFRCEVHPTTMEGTIEVGGAPAGGGQPAPAGGGGQPSAQPPGGGGHPSAGGQPSGAPSSASAQPPAGGAPSGPVDVTAQNLAFDKTTIALPAGGQDSIHFTNNDAGVPHNIVIFSADPSTDPNAKTLFTGEPVTGPGSTDYTFKAPPPGQYFFHCEFHPDTMKGTVTVG
ncbi:MAG: cupredoxin domain-containing protein [Actinomycetota bacterium]